jgi:DMSO/TMAO reductase YedYZ molybdopterin-dependent catalytic subunit
MAFNKAFKNQQTIRQLYRSIGGMLLLVGLSSCQSTVSKAQLDRWHQAAVAENDRLTQIHASSLTKNWKLHIQGQIQTPITLTWPEIEALSNAQITSRKPYPDSPKTPFEFRGVPVKALLERAGVQPGTEEVTIVASDAYYATMSLKDFVAHQGLLAITENGKPIPRNDGGPLHLVFFNDPKQSDLSVQQQQWVYYVTHLIIGTEPIALKVGNRTLGRSDLEKLPQQRITTLVGYKIGWESEPVQLRGVLVRDILSRQKIAVDAKSVLKIRRKAMTDNDPQKSVLIPTSLIKSCDVMLAHRWGPDGQNIPGGKGGPLTLAYGNNCPSEVVKNLAWLPFVESITVESGGGQ